MNPADQVNAAIEKGAALAAFAALTADERARIWSTLDQAARDLLLAVDWTPRAGSELHSAYQAATACIAARYYGVAVPFAALVEDAPEHVVWALSDLLAHVLRTFPESQVHTALTRWGEMAVNGLADAEREGWFRGQRQ